MCGVGAVSILCRKHSPCSLDENALRESVIQAISPRGPDGSNSVAICGTSSSIMASLLHLRGPSKVYQPLRDSGGNILAWNGEVYGGGVHVHEGGNDTERVLEALGSTSSPDDVMETMASIEGEWSFVYYHSESRSLWWGRDPTGRRSLLIGATQAASDPPRVASIILSSTMVEAAPYGGAWSEIPTTGLFCLQIPPGPVGEDKECCSCVAVIHYPWEAARRPLALPRFVGEVLESTIDAAVAEAVKALRLALSDAVRRRVESIPPPSPASTPHGHPLPSARLGVLFSGGVDCMVIAALASEYLPEGEPIDLMNVCFADSHTSPDRVSAVDGVVELRHAIPHREWRLIRVDAVYDNVIGRKDAILKLCFPANTHMDFNIGSAFWSAAAGDGVVNIVPPTTRRAAPVKWEGEVEVASPDIKETEKETEKEVSGGRTLCPQPKCRKVIKAGCALGACKGCCTSIHKLSLNIPDEVFHKMQEGDFHSRSSSVIGEGEGGGGVAEVFASRLAAAHYPLSDIHKLRDGTACSVHKTRMRYVERLGEASGKLVLGQVVPPRETAAVTDRNVSKSLVTEEGAVNEEPLHIVSQARVLLIGIGADEQMAGYGRHRTAYRQRGWEGLAAELSLDMGRLWKRNLGRDDRCVSDHGKEARFPFLDEQVVKLISSLPLSIVADLRKPRGVGDKQLLRQVARELGLAKASSRHKRAIQFGSRIAKSSNLHQFGSNRKAKGDTVFDDGEDGEEEREGEE